MNKDVIYIEPEDDITDILTKIKNSQSKIVALVPPKKAGVMRSAVNFKLINKAAHANEKTVVLISSDDSLVKLAATTQMPVAKNLQSKPQIPDQGSLSSSQSSTENDIIDEAEADAIAAAANEDPAAAKPSDAKTDASDSEAIIEEIAISEASLKDIDDSDDKADAGQKKLHKTKPKVPDFKKYRKFIIAGAVALVLFIGFLVWALAFAPAAHIAVTVKTTPENFSETISFVTDPSAADPENGVFLLEEETITKTASVDFTATGEVDKGEKAKGTITVKRSSPVSASSVSAITIPKGQQFNLNGLSYVTTSSATLAEVDEDDCDFVGFDSCNLTKDYTATVSVEATMPGSSYNTTSNSGWSSSGRGYVVASSEISGGTTKIIKVVSESDISNAQKSLANTNESEGKSELLANFPSDLIPIETSFKMEAKDPVSSPALDAEVASGVTPKLTAETTFTMYGVDATQVSDYIESVTLAGLSGAEPQKVYSTGVSEDKDENKAFIESFRETNGTYTAKLKSTTQVGPEVTDSMVAEKSLGKKVGEVQSLLKSINGISSVNVDTSFFWVTSVPNDINKVTIEITVE